MNLHALQNISQETVRANLLTNANNIVNAPQSKPILIHAEKTDYETDLTPKFHEITYTFDGSPLARESTKNVIIRINFRDGITPDYELLRTIATELKKLKDISVNLKATCKLISRYVVGSLAEHADEIGLIDGNNINTSWSRIKYPVHTIGYLKIGDQHIAIDATAPIHTMSTIDKKRSEQVEAEVFISTSIAELLHDIQTFCPGGNWNSHAPIDLDTYQDLQTLHHAIIKTPDNEKSYLSEWIKEDDIIKLSKYPRKRFQEQKLFSVQPVTTSEYAVIFSQQYRGEEHLQRYLTAFSSSIQLKNGEKVRVIETVPKYATEHLLPLINEKIDKTRALQILNTRSDIPLQSFVFFQTLLLKALAQ